MLSLLGKQPKRLKAGSHMTVMVPAVPAVVPVALPGTCPRQIFFNGNTCPRYRRQMKNLMETLIPGTAGQLQASYRYANYKVASNSRSNACKMAPFVNKDLCRGSGLILFLSVSNG